MSTIERKRIVNYSKPVIQIPQTKTTPISFKVPVTNQPPIPAKKTENEIERIGVSVEQAAEMLSLSVRSVWVLVKDGRIRHVKFGTRCIVSVQSIREFVDGRQDSTTPMEDNDKLQCEPE